MSKIALRTASSFTAFAICSLWSAGAMAQVGGDPVAAQSADEAVPAKEIVVTGSLIRGSSEDAPAPVDVISADELAKQGSPSALELIKNLPTSNGVIGDANQFDARSQGNEGVASINLRGLGPQRTLVLLNGKRIVQSGGSGIPIVDVNLIPSAAIGRIEVLKDGAAATYGSDAIAGVVNFITKTDQQGFLASGDYRYIKGSKGDYGGALSFGHSEDNFRFFVSAGYQHRSELQTTDRDFTIQPYATNPQGGFTGGGNPGNFDFNGAGVGNPAIFTSDQGCTPLGGFRSLPGSTTDRCFVNFAQFDNLVEPEDRFQIFADTQFDLSDRVKLRLNGLWGHSKTRITTSPSYLPTLPPSANSAFGGAGLFVIPGYTPALRDYCATFGAASTCATTNGVLNSAIAFPVLFRPFLLGGNPLYGGRGSAHSPRKSDEFLVSAELDFELNDNLNVTSSLTYSEYDRYFEGTDTFGDLLQNALAGFGGPSCPYASTASRVGLSAAQLAALAGTNGCTYFNPFSTAVQMNAVTGATNPAYAGSRSTNGLSLTPGAGLINDLATIDQFFVDSSTQANTSQWVADAVLSGETGINLPGGAVGFALGGQYRTNKYSRIYGGVGNLRDYPCPGTPLNPAAVCSPQTGAQGFLGTNFNAFAKSDVYAVFAELQLPITDAIQAQLSARYEDYGGNVGSTFDPQARIKIQLTDWLAIRGGAGSTFRGPPAQQLKGNLTSLQVIGTSFRAIDINGNPNLAPESANTYSGGVIVETGPFKASVDYFRYDFNGPIEGEPVAGIVNAMFGATGSANCGNSAYAALQARFTFTGAGCGIGNVQRLRTQAVNSADVSTSGVDFQASFENEFGDNGKVTLGFSGTYIIEYKTDAVTVEGIVVQPAFDAVGLLNYQTTAYPLPQWKGNAYAQGDFGPHSLRVQYNYIDGYTDQRGAAVFGPNTGALAGAAVTTGKKIGSFSTVDVTYRLALDTGTTIALSAQNVFDKDPPFARLDYNYDPFTGNPLGRTLKVAVSQAF
ncbi:TonB-dependent receptor plug domain-containing protein [Novosphingobium tardum]|uniref:TonB-dependent receptor plug domain-containing protein n=1 Tax=Novosphingobium tardum TaxID=1538021 RepID=A0ABV8RPX7_9SPHN